MIWSKCGKILELDITGSSFRHRVTYLWDLAVLIWFCVWFVFFVLRMCNFDQTLVSSQLWSKVRQSHHWKWESGNELTGALQTTIWTRRDFNQSSTSSTQQEIQQTLPDLPWPITATAWNDFPNDLLQNCSLTYDKGIFQFNLWQNCSLTYDKTIFQLNLWQKCSLTYDKSTVGPVTK